MVILVPFKKGSIRKILIQACEVCGVWGGGVGAGTIMSSSVDLISLSGVEQMDIQVLVQGLGLGWI